MKSEDSEGTSESRARGERDEAQALTGRTLTSIDELRDAVDSCRRCTLWSGDAGCARRRAGASGD